MKKLLSLFLAAFWPMTLTSIPAHAENSWSKVVNELMENNPALKSMGTEIVALEQVPDAALAWDDPMITAGVINIPTDSFRLDEQMMTQKIIGVTQRIGSHHTRSAERSLALADVGMAKANRKALKSNMVMNLRLTISEMIYVQRALEILTKNESALDSVIEVANAKYSSGKGVQANVIQAQVERSKLIDTRLNLDEKLGLTKIRANRLLGRDTDTDFIPPPLPEPAGVVPKFYELWVQAKDRAPAILLAKQELEKSKAVLTRAESLTGTNMSISARYGQRDDSPIERADFTSITAAFSVPIWKSGKQARQIAGARLKAQSVEEALDDAIRKTEADLRQALTSLGKVDDSIHLYRQGLITQANQALESSMVAYQLDKVDFLTLMASEINLLKLELELEKLLLRKRNLYAQIAALTGADIAR